MLPPALNTVVLAAAPAWVWATLVMIGFVVLTVLTMWLARFPVTRKPPPVVPPPAEDSDSTSD